MSTLFPDPESAFAEAVKWKDELDEAQTAVEPVAPTDPTDPTDPIDPDDTKKIGGESSAA